MTTWSCPGCHLELVTVAIAAGHECPGRGGQWTDLTPDFTEASNRNANRKDLP
jgi:hypothetical protein